MSEDKKPKKKKRAGDVFLTVTGTVLIRITLCHRHLGNRIILI